MEQMIKQWYAIKFCAKLGKSYTVTNQLIQQAYGDSALSTSQVSRWLKMFKESWEEVIENPRSGRTLTSHTDEKVTCARNLLNSDHWMSVRMIPLTLNLQIATVHTIITNNLNMQKVCAKLVHEVLTDKQKAY